VINYTERLTLLVRDVVARLPELRSVNPDRVLVFARPSGPRLRGLYAACHALIGSPSAPTQYTWRSRDGRIVRQSEWFVLRHPIVEINGVRIDHLISIMLPRFCTQTLQRSAKREMYARSEPWIARLDTVVHELYHIDPRDAGLRRLARADGAESRCVHNRAFYETVARLTEAYLDSRPAPDLIDFLRYDFRELTRRYGGVAAAVFRQFPAFPAPRREPASGPAPSAGVRLVRLPVERRPARFTEADLAMREFFAGGTRALGAAVVAARPVRTPQPPRLAFPPAPSRPVRPAARAPRAAFLEQLRLFE
jgi:hypothetical protein